MRKSIKFLAIILIFLVLVFFASFFLYKKHPELGNQFLKKIPIINRFVNNEQTKTEADKNKKNEITDPIVPEDEIEEKPEKFTNKDVYQAICDNDEHINPNEDFIGCNRCPKYLDKENLDYFHLNSFFEGMVIKKHEKEAIFFMKGCLSKSDDNGVAIVLRKGFGGWHRVADFKQILWDEPPLAFKDKQDFLMFVGKRKITTDTNDKETLFYVNFKNNKQKTIDILTVDSSNNLSCDYQYLAALNKPSKISENKFSIKIEAMGRHDALNADCHIPSKKLHIKLNPGSYSLNFTKKDDKFIADKNSQRVITELEKAQE